MKLLGLITLCFFTFVSCGGSNECTGKQVTCPPFNDNLSSQWIPYKINQQVIFNSAAANDTFNLSDVSFSESYQATVSARQPSCSATANFTTAATYINGEPKFSVEIILQNNQFNNTQEKQVYFRIKGASFQGGGFSDTGLVKTYDLSLSHFYNTAIVGSKTFSNVQEVYIDTTKIIFKTPQVYKFWVAKNIGVVGYEEYHGNLWVKQ